ncbi:OprD family porin [Acinetobacter sp. YH12136]|uniref:OprD family porin n=1 Tax=Acinetobacter sp. YH12136 TaxID=2601120 RepID=UPI00211E8718
MSTGQVFAQNTTDQWTFTLRNAYINREFDSTDVKDTGSWSQAASLFYKSNMIDTPLEIADQPIKVGVDASVQYAVRLSDDKHVSDSVLPFNTADKSQASDHLKYGATLKVGYDQTLLRVGELWLDTPITSVDRSRQLLTSYWGTNLQSQINDQLKVELGRVEKVSPRNEENFRKFSKTVNGVKYESDGLNYIDLRYQFSPSIKGEYYFGQLEDLYDTHYASLEHNWKQPKFTINSKVKYFNAQEDNRNLGINAGNFGILETLKVNNHSVGLGYQEISGESAYPLPDGFLPELYFINWGTTGFFKENEKSYHLIYSYDFKNYMPGLKATLKYSYGNDFKAANGKKNEESESSVNLNYDFQQSYLKGFGMQLIRIDNQIKYGNDFSETRFFVNYKKSF